MIIFIDLRGQNIEECTTCFAFYYTTSCRFLSISDTQIFESVEDFIDCVDNDKSFNKDRLLKLISSDYYKVGNHCKDANCNEMWDKDVPDCKCGWSDLSKCSNFVGL